LRIQKFEKGEAEEKNSRAKETDDVGKA